MPAGVIEQEEVLVIEARVWVSALVGKASLLRWPGAAVLQRRPGDGSELIHDHRFAIANDGYP